MADFSDLTSLYQHLEDHAIDYKYPHQIGVLFQKVRDRSSKDNRKGEAEKAQWEVDFFNLRLEGGKAKPGRRFVAQGGKLTEYPSSGALDDEVFTYLVERLESTKNLVLAARYSHILWHSPSKHHRYAHIAADSYLNLTRIYEEKDRNSPTVHWGLDALDAVANAWRIACGAGYRVDDISLLRLKSCARRARYFW